MTRFEITLGLLAIIGTIAVTAMVGLREDTRMARAKQGWDKRAVESGAQMFSQYCASCHGPNASGGICPPLNQKSGLHGGDLGQGVAWRLEQLGWDRTLTYEYVYSVVSTGRTISTRPNQYPGNRVEPAPPAAGAPTPAHPYAPVMAMPAWAQTYGGPLRPDQIRDLAMYVSSFRDFLPDPADPDALKKGRAFADQYRPTPTSPSAPASAVTSTMGTTGTVGALSPEERGAQVWAGKPCGSCHTLPGVSEGKTCPSLAGIAATAGTRIKDASYTGSAKTADDYLRESIKNPSVYAAPGYQPNVMPMLPLSDDEVSDLIAYLKKQGG